MASIKLNPPWVTYAYELSQMFLYDKEVHVVYDSDNAIINVYVDSAVKAGALNQIIPNEVEFGNITLKIAVTPANGLASSWENIYEVAFKGNEAFSFVKVVRGVFENDLTYVVFKNKVVQYWNDDLGDIYGQCSTLYEDIARRVFRGQDGVFFCTDVPSDGISDLVDKPLGEWP